MIVAVSAQGPTLDHPVDERFGRAEYLLIVDSDSFSFEAVDNSVNRDALEGAGLGAAEIVGRHGADAVITGHLGPKAFRALMIADASGYDGRGMTVREAVVALEAGELERLSEGEAHAGQR